MDSEQTTEFKAVDIVGVGGKNLHPIETRRCRRRQARSEIAMENKGAASAFRYERNSDRTTDHRLARMESPKRRLLQDTNLI